MNRELPTRDRGATGIPAGAGWTPPATLVQLEHLLQVIRRWADTAEDRRA